MHVPVRRPAAAVLVPLLAAAALVAGPRSAPAADEGVPGANFRARLVERASRRGYDGAVRGRFRLRLAGETTSPTIPATFGVRMGGLAFDVALSRGRFSGPVETEGGRVTARVAWRRGAVSVVVNGRTDEGGGTVYAGEPFEGGIGDWWGRTLHGLRAAAVLHDEASTTLGVGIAGRTDVTPRRSRRPLERNLDLYAVDLIAAGVVPTDRAGRPSLQLVPPRSGERAAGRVRGHCVAAGSLPVLTYTSSYDVTKRVLPRDEAVREFGEGLRFAPGVSILELPEGFVFQQRFDFAVQAPPGPQQVIVHAEESVPGHVQVVRNFRIAAPVPPLLLDANGHVLETRGPEDEDGGGALWAWGDNLFGQVGDGTTRDPVSPVPLAMPASAIALAAGDDFSVAADADGVVWLWGEWDRTRALGGGVSVTEDVAPDSPAPFLTIPGLTALAAGDDHVLALDADGAVFSFGENTSGQLGDGTRQDRPFAAEQVGGLPPVVAVAAGWESSLALDGDGAVWSWGDVFLDGTGTRRPVRVDGLPRITAIAADGFAAALDMGGRVWAWGANDVGQLGRGDFEPSDAPVRVLLPGNAVAIDVGGSHGLALLEDGTVWGWGANAVGELGDGTREDRPLPVRAADLDDVARVVAGAWFSLAVETDGTVRLWGGLVPEVGAPPPDYPVIVPRGFRRGHYPLSDVVDPFDGPVVTVPKRARR